MRGGITSVDSSLNLGDPVPLLKEQCRPIFVVGMNGSGTSMLADCLGLHPELFATPWETRLIPYLIINTPKFGDLNNDENFLALWKAVLNIPAFTQMNAWKPLRLPKNWRDFPRELPSVIDAVFRSISLQHNKQRWAEKTPQNIQHLCKLGELFTGAKFIHIIRDGRDCAASFHRRWQRTPEFTIYRWKRVLQEGESQGKKLGDRYFQLRYEDITTNPDLWMRKICKFVELPFDDVILRSNQPHQEKWGELGNIQPNSEKWKTYFTEKKIKNLEKIAGMSLHNYGYNVRNKTGNKNPNVMQKFFWKWRDAYKEFQNMGMKKLTGKTKRLPWSRIVKFVQTSIRQSRANKF